jgi:hypothetical protein
MLSPTRGVLRGLRAASLGVVGVVLALVGHVAAGGAAPRPVDLLLLAGLAGLAALLLTGVRLSPVRLVLSLTAMQLVLHEAFMLLGAPTACVMTPASTPAGGGMSHAGQPMLGCATGMAEAGMGQTSMFAGTAMVGAHIAATAVMAALLTYGEKVLWLLAGWVLPPRWLRVVLPELPEVRVGSSPAPTVVRARFAYGGVGLRGPPLRGLLAIV